MHLIECLSHSVPSSRTDPSAGRLRRPGEGGGPSSKAARPSGQGTMTRTSHTCSAPPSPTHPLEVPTTSQQALRGPGKGADAEGSTALPVQRGRCLVRFGALRSLEIKTPGGLGEKAEEGLTGPQGPHFCLLPSRAPLCPSPRQCRNGESTVASASASWQRLRRQPQVSPGGVFILSTLPQPALRKW